MITQFTLARKGVLNEQCNVPPRTSPSAAARVLLLRLIEVNNTVLSWEALINEPWLARFLSPKGASEYGGGGTAQELEHSN